jgi:hypothetical protein
LGHPKHRERAAAVPRVAAIVPRTGSPIELSIWLLVGVRVDTSRETWSGVMV